MRNSHVLSILFFGLAIVLSIWFGILQKTDLVTKLEPNLKPSVINKPFGQPISKEPGALPNDWMGRQRLYPDGRFNQRAYLDVLHQLQIKQSEMQDERRHRIQWEQAGPTNIGGRITDLAIHPDHPETIYVGTASGGIYISTNLGQSWTHIFNESPVIAVGDLAIDPNNPAIIYTGTGEANASSFSFPGNGMYKSIDSGESWIHTGLEEAGYFGRIIVDYNNSERIYAAVTGSLFSPNEQRGVYRSMDAGNSWDRVLFITDTTAAIDLIQHSENPEIFFASMWERSRGLNYRRSGGPSSGIYKSIDGGDSWTELTTGLPQGDDVGRIGLTLCKSQPEILYALYDSQMDEDDDYSFAGIYKTENGGESWNQTNDDQLYGMNSSFGWYFGQIRVDPNNPERVYGLGVDLVRSVNGGESWDVIAGYFNMEEIHVDHHAMIIDEENGSIWIGNDGGLYNSTNFGDSWTHFNNLPLNQFYAINIDPSFPDAIYGGTQDNGTLRFWEGGVDSWEKILGGDGFYTAINPMNHEIIYAEYQWGQIKRSINHGENWQPINEEFRFDRTNWSTPFIMDMNSPEILYAGTYRVWKTINNGDSWYEISDDLTMGDDGSSYHTITTLDIHLSNPDMILAGTDDGQIHLMNGENNWADISEGLPDRWITQAAFDPHNEEGIFVACSGFRWDEQQPHVFYSDDLGNSWENISGDLPDLPVNCLLPDPDIPGQIVIGTDGGVFITETGGETWSILGDGMPAVPVIDIKLHPEARTLIAGTYGCSVFRTSLPLVQTGDPTQDGLINVLDIVFMVSVILNDIIPTEYEYFLCDLDENGSVDIIDIILVIDIILEG